MHSNKKKYIQINLNRNINIYQITQNRFNLTGYYRKFILQELHAAHFEVYLGKDSFQLSKTDAEKKKTEQNNKTLMLYVASYQHIF